jgi:Ca2+-binding RTX toxin-like protein
VTGSIDGAGGINTLDYSLYTTNVAADLTTGTATRFTAGVSNFVHVTGGSGNDTLTGSAADNVLIGNGGNDRLEGGPGNDNLTGGSGNDTLDGGSGNDSLAGALGNDVYRFTATASAETDTVVELSAGGTDTVDFSLLPESDSALVNLGSDNLAGHTNRTIQTGVAGQWANWENAIGGAGHDNMTGNTANNSLVGGSGNDTIAGLNGNDSLEGAGGSDSLIGGAGNDAYFFRAAPAAEIDVVLELAGGGTDLLDFSSLIAADPVAVDLSSDTDLAIHANRTVQTGATGQSVEFENATGGAGNDALVGNGMNNSLIGGLGNDSIVGAGGNDSIEGGAGNDSLAGSLGNDIYIFRGQATRIA